MKKILLFFALPFFMISCFSEAFSGEEDAQCGDGTFVCRQDAEGRTESYLCHYDEDFERENLNLFEKCQEYDRKGHVKKSIKLLQNAAKKYPTNYTILMHLVKEMNFEYCDDTVQEKQNSEKVIEISTRVLNECTDRHICNSVTNEMIVAFKKLGKMEEAIDIAKEQPTIWETSNFRLIELLTGDELVTHCKNTVLQFVLATYSVLVKLADLDFANNKMAIRDRIAVVDKILKMLELVYEGNYGYESKLVYIFYKTD